MINGDIFIVTVIYAYVYIFVALTVLFQSIRLKWLRAYLLTHVIVSESTTQDLLTLKSDQEVLLEISIYL